MKKRLGLTTKVFIGLILGAICVGKIINPGIGLDMSAVQVDNTTVGEAKALSDVLLDIIPSNPIESLSSGNMLQIIVFAILLV